MWIFGRAGGSQPNGRRGRKTRQDRASRPLQLERLEAREIPSFLFVASIPPSPTPGQTPGTDWTVAAAADCGPSQTVDRVASADVGEPADAGGQAPVIAQSSTSPAEDGNLPRADRAADFAGLFFNRVGPEHLAYLAVLDALLALDPHFPNGNYTNGR
jgi:hypothetical protein